MCFFMAMIASSLRGLLFSLRRNVKVRYRERGDRHEEAIADANNGDDTRLFDGANDRGRSGDH